MKFKDIKVGMRVCDRWWPSDYYGIVKELLKTRVKVSMGSKGLVTYDRSHVQFLEKSK